jgi:D,D-heptose 1,7-bisphosphate phosphatase
MGSLAADLPKVLLPVGGKPVLQHQLELSAKAGITEVTIFAGHLAENIQAFVGDGSQFGLRVRVSVETEPLGNAGALLRQLDSLPAHFCLIYGDVMHAVDLQRLAGQHFYQRADFTLMVHPNDHPHDSDLLELDTSGRVTAIHACPHPQNKLLSNLVNAGIYMIRRDALRHWGGINENQDFTKDVICDLIANGGRVFGYRSYEYARDMGTPDRLQQVERDWQAGRICVTDSCRPAVFLDRDGTLNVERGFLSNHEDLKLIEGVPDALRNLRIAGFRLVVLSNQPVIARGEADEEDVAAINQRLEWELGKNGAYLDAIYFCPHHPDNGFAGERKELKIACDCRKPGTGLLERACAEIPIDVSISWMIGDQTRDIEMARRAGLRSILVKTGAGGQDSRFDAKADYIASDMTDAASFILRHAGAAV